MKGALFSTACLISFTTTWCHCHSPGKLFINRSHERYRIVRANVRTSVRIFSRLFSKLCICTKVHKFTKGVEVSYEQNSV